MKTNRIYFGSNLLGGFRLALHSAMSCSDSGNFTRYRAKSLALTLEAFFMNVELIVSLLGCVFSAW
jgi:hypothetical protein